MAVALGIAFREQAGREDQGRRPRGRRQRRRPSPPSRSSSAGTSGSRWPASPARSGRGRSRSGKTDLVVAAAGGRRLRVLGRAEPGREHAGPGRGRRAPLLQAGRRRRPARWPSSTWRRSGQPVHRLPAPGPARHEPDGRRAVGRRVRRWPTCASASCSSGSWPRRCGAATSCCRSCISRMLFTVPEVLVLLVFGWLVFGVHESRGSLAALVVLIVLRGGLLRRARAAGRQPGARRSRPCPG